LLDALAIDTVAVVGISAGGPGALQFVLRHPDQAKALILLSAISRRTGLSEDQRNSTLGRLVMTPRFPESRLFPHQSGDEANTFIGFARLCSHGNHL
jgi:pimeloyl-ACP methyl ester carboxylesterase